jgi:hypothetical protein
MPFIDVDDVLRDPDIAGTTFSVIRRAETVNNYGETTTTDTVIPNCIGAIFPTGDNSLVREEGYTTKSATITVVTTFFLRGASKQAGANYQPDIVLWNGDHYLVSTVNDYSQYGAGMIEAECIATEFVPQAPA